MNNTLSFKDSLIVLHQIISCRFDSLQFSGIPGISVFLDFMSTARICLACRWGWAYTPSLARHSAVLGRHCSLTGLLSFLPANYIWYLGSSVCQWDHNLSTNSLKEFVVLELETKGFIQAFRGFRSNISHITGCKFYLTLETSRHVVLFCFCFYRGIKLCYTPDPGHLENLCFFLYHSGKYKAYENKAEVAKISYSSRMLWSQAWWITVTVIWIIATNNSNYKKSLQ